jgi:hydroxymethylglutaryl-CoA reductase (NADPH)
MSKWERRSYFRVKEKLLLSLFLRDRETKKRNTFKGEAIDIGVAGLSISTERTLPNVDQGLIEIILPPPFQPVKARIRIKWRKDEKHFYGIGFTSSPENNLVDWEKFVKGSSSTLPDRRHMEEGRRSNAGAPPCPSLNQEKRKTLRRIEDLWREGESDLKQSKRSSISRADLIPNLKGIDYTHQAAESRREWLSLKTGASLKHIGVFSEAPENMKGNIENFIGVAQIPIGIAGPLRINGEFAKGDFYVPMATTEGTLVYTYAQGMQLISLAGGATTAFLKDEIHISPLFGFEDVRSAQQFIQWLNSNFKRIKEEAEKTTRYGKLERLEPHILDRNVVVKFCYTTGDAAGFNMITLATDAACKFINAVVKPEKFYLQSNFSSIKKVTAHNFVAGYGRAVIAEATIPRKLIQRFYGINPDEMVKYFNQVLLTTTHAGMIGMNGHTANALAALFIACGQDVASIVESHASVINFEIIQRGDLYASVKLPNLVIGAVGGGTGLGTQRESLEMLDCYGANRAKKLAEIAAATVLSGEIAICAANAAGLLVRAFEKNREKTVSHQGENSLCLSAHVHLHR